MNVDEVRDGERELIGAEADDLAPGLHGVAGETGGNFDLVPPSLEGSHDSARRDLLRVAVQQLELGAPPIRRRATAALRCDRPS